MELLRKASPEERASLALSLSDSVIELARRAIARANPNADEQDEP